LDFISLKSNKWNFQKHLRVRWIELWFYCLIFLLN